MARVWIRSHFPISLYRAPLFDLIFPVLGAAELREKLETPLESNHHGTSTRKVNDVLVPGAIEP